MTSLNRRGISLNSPDTDGSGLVRSFYHIQHTDLVSGPKLALLLHPIQSTGKNINERPDFEGLISVCLFFEAESHCVVHDKC